MGIIEERRSSRKFEDKIIDKDIMLSIYKAGILAPSPKNRQPWEYIVISNHDEKKRFIQQIRIDTNKLYTEKPNRRDILRSFDTFDIIEQCSVLVLVCYKNNTAAIHDDGVDWDISAKDIEALDLMSIGASIENMLLKAQSLGVASLWCGDILYAYNVLKQYSNYPVVSAICFGYSKANSQKPLRKEINDVFRFIE